MGFFDEPIRSEVADVRPGILHLLQRHHQSPGSPLALLDLANRHLRLNPEDAEVKAARARLTADARGACCRAPSGARNRSRGATTAAPRSGSRAQRRAATPRVARPAGRRARYAPLPQQRVRRCWSWGRGT